MIPKFCPFSCTLGPPFQLGLSSASEEKWTLHWPPGPRLGCRSHSLVVVEAVLGSQVGADRRRVLGAFTDDPGFTVKADLPREGKGWDPAWPLGKG